MSLGTATRLVDVYSGESYVLRQNVFDQDKQWRQGNGEIIDIDMMELSHVENTIKLLERRAGHLHMAYFMDVCSFMDGPLGPSGDMATMAADEAMGELAEMSPGEWLDDTPLMKALRARLAAGKPPVRRIKTPNPFGRKR